MSRHYGRGPARWANVLPMWLLTWLETSLRTLLVLVVGVGSLAALSQRRKPVVLLIAVPLMALLAAAAWGVFRKGFSIPSARYSLTWLDGERSGWRVAKLV